MTKKTPAVPRKSRAAVTTATPRQVKEISKSAPTRKKRAAGEAVLSVAAPAAEPAAGQRVGYVRVSTVDQNTARQLDGVPVARTFEDHASGKDANRPALAEMLAYVRAGDTVTVHSLDRLGRSLVDLRQLVDTLTGRGVRVEFLKENLTFEPGGSSPMSNLLLSMLGAVAEFERSLILERQREGIAQAKQRGAYKGRAPALSPAQADELRRRAAAGENRAALARELGISRKTLYVYLQDQDQDDG